MANLNSKTLKTKGWFRIVQALFSDRNTKLDPERKFRTMPIYSRGCYGQRMKKKRKKKRPTQKRDMVLSANIRGRILISY